MIPILLWSLDRWESTCLEAFAIVLGCDQPAVRGHEVAGRFLLAGSLCLAAATVYAPRLPGWQSPLLRSKPTKLATAAVASSRAFGSRADTKQQRAVSARRAHR